MLMLNCADGQPDPGRGWTKAGDRRSVRSCPSRGIMGADGWRSALACGKDRHAGNAVSEPPVLLRL